MKKGKRMMSALLALLMAITCCMGVPTGVSAAAVKKANGFKYRYNAEYQGIELMKYTGKSEVVAIPSEMEGMPVTAIGEECFRKRYGIVEITMPDTVSVIGKSAFSHCSIQKIELSPNLKTIGNYAFYSDENLKSIRIPDSVKEMGSAVFEDCYSLEEIVWPKKVKKISYSTFEFCYALKSIEIPSGVKVIGQDAFMGCGLTEITIPSSVTRIDDFAFAGCHKLEKIEIPANAKLKKIGYHVFEECDQLKTIKLPASIEELEKCAFENSCFEKISFAKNAKLKKIPDECFGSCSNLKEVDFPKNVTTLGEDLFVYFRDEKSYSNKVMKINIMGGKIKKVGNNAFKGLNAKGTISVPSKYKAKYKKLFKKQSWYKPTMKIK